jgi:hypothetical protein
MYVNNVREAIQSLDNQEYQEYLNQLRKILRRNYSKNVKPFDLRNRVDKFVNGNKPNIDYFESYLITFDELSDNGGINSLSNNKIKSSTSWRKLLLKVTQDRTFSSEINNYLEDEKILAEVKAIFYNSITYCKADNKQHFFNNLKSFNEFIKIGM